MLGKTGVGKSSLGNTILGEKLFQTKCSPNSETSKCESQNKVIDGKDIHVIDTPGVFDTNPRSAELSPEILKCIENCAEGVHAFLIVLKVEKYTQQEQAVVDLILKFLSKEVLKYATLVFTHGSDLQGMNIKDWATQNDALKNLLKKCGGRCHAFDNTSTCWNNTQEVESLLKTIDETVEKNEKRCYTNEMLSKGETLWGELRKKLKRISVGALLGALLGVGAIVGLVHLGTPVLVAAMLVAISTGGIIGGAVAANLSDRQIEELSNNAKSYLKEIDILFNVQSSVSKTVSRRCIML